MYKLKITITYLHKLRATVTFEIIMYSNCMYSNYNTTVKIMCKPNKDVKI